MALLEKIVSELMENKLTLVAVPVFFLVWLICKFLFLDALMSPLRRLPGPPVSLLMGNLPEIRRKGFLPATLEWTKKYGGMFVMWPRPDRPVVYLTDVDLVKQVLVTDCYKYSRPDFLRKMIPPLGNSLLASNGKDHAWQRKMLNPAFSYANLKGMVPFMKAAADDLIELWQNKIDESPTVYADVKAHEDLTRLTLDVIGESAFGYQFKSVLKGDTDISKAFAQHTTGVNFTNSPLRALPFYSYLPLEENRLKKKATKLTNEVVLQVIKERRKMKEMGQSLARKDLLDIAMDMQDDQSGFKMDDEQLRGQVFTFLIAGHETTSTSMSWTLYELAKHPEIQEKVRKEANEVLSDGSDVTWAKLDELQYLSNCIKESMRLNSAVNGVGRSINQDGTLGTYHIPAGSTIFIGLHAVHRSEKYWPDPCAFKPERFENITKEQESMMRYILMPFSFGPRVCIGNKFATAEMRLVLASLVQNFKFSLVPGFPKVTEVIELTTKPYPSLQLRVRSVNGDE